MLIVRCDYIRTLGHNHVALHIAGYRLLYVFFSHRLMLLSELQFMLTPSIYALCKEENFLERKLSKGMFMFMLNFLYFTD